MMFYLDLLRIMFRIFLFLMDFYLVPSQKRDLRLSAGASHI